MSAPVDIKPATPKRPRRAAPLEAVPATQLCADQVRLLRLFSAMDQTRQGHLFIVAEGFAENFPRAATPPLRLIVGGIR